jgi:hypothetical protein
LFDCSLFDDTFAVTKATYFYTDYAYVDDTDGNACLNGIFISATQIQNSESANNACVCFDIDYLSSLVLDSVENTYRVRMILGYLCIIIVFKVV